MRYILCWDQVKESQKSQQAAKLSILVNAFLKTPIQKRQALHRRPSIFILPYFHASIFHISDVVVLDFSGFSYAQDLRNQAIGRPGFSVFFRFTPLDMWQLSIWILSATLSLLYQLCPTSSSIANGT